jgi:hypothetical protein
MMIACKTEGLRRERVGGLQQQWDTCRKRKVELRKGCDNNKNGGVVARECVACDQAAKEN